ncbi:MAG: FAD-dependent oxidoreductase [Rhodobacteraceae bacterium]|nr:FAD-dependent oxidoreductase [Paracoccaceae bacterium]
MPFELSARPPRRIAVIGGGISGMAAAYLLAETDSVTLVEGAARLGGHARTVIAGRRGDQPVDTGFIVFNRVNYPHLARLFDRLGVPVADSDMSFGVSIDGGRIEYGLASLSTIFTQRRNALRPRFLGMLRDILRFNRLAPGLCGDPGLTIGGLIELTGGGDWFRDYYLTPLSGAIWSTPTRGILDFPARTMIEFLRNHALLDYSEKHRWLTVRGGSIQYVRRLERHLLSAGVEIATGSPVVALRRSPAGVELRRQGGEWERFDEVVLATHSDDSLRLISDATPEERQTLAAIRYQPNTAILHADASVMPRRRGAWSSWVYTEERGARPDAISLTYWMNSLQPIPRDDPMFVTLNPVRPIRDELIYDQTIFRHPVYDLAAIAAQERLRATNGRGGLWFCGAWMRNGFHEDGFASAVDVVQAMSRLRERRLVA